MITPQLANMSVASKADHVAALLRMIEETGFYLQDSMSSSADDDLSKWETSVIRSIWHAAQLARLLMTDVVDFTDRTPETRS